MTINMEVYRCAICGNIVEVLHAGAGQLVCCGQPMNLQTANTVDASEEKHLPVMEKSGEGLQVRVGEVPHPMSEEHYIEWIESSAGDTLCRKSLAPSDAPEALFCGDSHPEYVRAYCNLHGLWEKKG